MSGLRVTLRHLPYGKVKVAVGNTQSRFIFVAKLTQDLDGLVQGLRGCATLEAAEAYVAARGMRTKPSTSAQQDAA